MDRTSLNFWIDFMLFVAMVGLVATGAMMYFALPAGTGRFFVVLGLDRHGYGVIHAWFAAAAVLLTVVHVALHWEWVCCVVGRSCKGERPCRPAQIKWGIAFAAALAVILFLGVWLAKENVEPAPDAPGFRGGRGYMPPSGNPSPGGGRRGSFR